MMPPIFSLSFAPGQLALLLVPLALLALCLLIYRLLRRRNDEQPLQQLAAELWATQFERDCDGLLLVDAKSDLVLRCNQPAVALFEAHSEAALCGVPASTLLTTAHRDRHSADADPHAAAFDELVAAGVRGDQSAAASTVRQVELKTRRDNRVPVRVQHTPLAVEQQALVLYRLQDLTDQRRTEQSLQLTQQRHHALFEHSNDAIVVNDLSGRIVNVNRKAVELLGYSAAEFYSLPVQQIYTEQALHTARFAFDRVFSRGFVRFDTELRCKDGSTFDAEVSANVVTLHQDRLIQGIIRDLTERKRAEAALLEGLRRAEAAQHIQSDFIAAVSYEIRSAMHGILGMNELLDATELSPHQQEYVQAARESAEVLVVLLSDILDFSELEMQPIALQILPFSVSDCIEEVVASLASAASQKGLELLYHIDETVPALVMGDDQRIRQVVGNLVTNAVQYTNQGEIVINVGLDPLFANSTSVDLPSLNPLAAELAPDTDNLDTGDPAGATSTADQIWHLRISVADTGTGIPGEQRDRLFQPFYRLPPTTRDVHGTGLGLAISARLIEAMGGSIEVESELGQGSTFCVALPVFSADNGDGNLVLHRSPLDGCSLLIVERVAASRQLIALYCQRWGARVRVAASHDEALDLLSQAEASGRPFDAAIVAMPAAASTYADAPQASLSGEENHREGGLHSREDAVAAASALHTSAGTPLPIVLLHPLADAASIASLLDASETARAVDAVLLSKPLRWPQLLDALRPFATDNPRSKPFGDPKAAPGTQGGRSQFLRTTQEPVRLLVVEDNAINQKLTLHMLDHLGYKADIVGSGAAALAAVEEQRYHIVFMDIQMPEMDGVETTKQLLQRADSLRPPRIVAMTASAMHRDRERCLAAGMSDYVTKPVRLEELARIIERWTQ